MDRNAWPELNYNEFKSTAHLLHMAVQVIGKLKLMTPFEPHWSNVALWLTAKGLTTGLIPYNQAAFGLDVDLQDHKIILKTTWGIIDSVSIESMSVAQLSEQILAMLQKAMIAVNINLKPQEIVNPIPFNQDVARQDYNKKLAHNWWQILISTYLVLKRYHSHYDGETPPIGLMWGTFDLRDARYNGNKITPTGINAGYIRRNAMNEAQVEVGFWPGNDAYQKPAFFSFIYPQPKDIENAKIKPAKARWDNKLFEFVLDYDDLRQSKQPAQDLLDFFESAFKVESQLAGWSSKLITTGEPA